MIDATEFRDWYENESPHAHLWHRHNAGYCLKEAVTDCPYCEEEA